MDRWIAKELKSRLPSLEGVTVLDCGCGDGHNSISLAELGASVTALDRADSIQAIQELADSHHLNIKTEQENLLDWKSTQQYDVVLFTHVLHFLLKQKRQLAMQRVLEATKAGGLLVFADLEDKEPVSDICVYTLSNALSNITAESFLIDDVPHEGANFPHSHKVFYLVGEKK